MPTPDEIKERFKAFFDAEYNNVEWDWDGNGGPRVLVDCVFDLDALVAALLSQKEIRNA